MDTDRNALAVIDRAFCAIEKPDHFTEYEHCDECAEHDETLRSHDRGTLQILHVANPAWNPLCFSSAQGIAYYMPTLARFFLNRSDGDSFARSFLFTLTTGGPYNELLRYCSTEQRVAIVALLSHAIETQAERFSLLGLDDDICQAHALWNGA